MNSDANNPIIVKLKQIGILFGGSLLWTCVLVGFVWSIGAIWFLPWLPGWLTKLLAVVYVAFGSWLFVGSFLQKDFGGRSFPFLQKWSRPLMAATVPIIYVATLFVQPTNDRQWAEDQRLLPEIVIDGSKVTINNLRDFRYRTPEDADPSYENLSFDVSDLESVWFIVQRFTRFNGMAHTFVSFGLDTPSGQKYFSISVEIRREQNELYSPTRGLYRNYELMYVVGTEQDLIGVRTNVRENDRVFLYKANATPKQTQDLFLKFAKRIEKLRSEPEFYNTLLNNCTNNIVAHSWSLTPQNINPLSPRILLPGYSAAVAFELGVFGDGKTTYEEFQKQSRIDQLARQAGITNSFSFDIRSGNSDKQN